MALEIRHLYHEVDEAGFCFSNPNSIEKVRKRQGIRNSRASCDHDRILFASLCRFIRYTASLHDGEHIAGKKLIPDGKCEYLGIR